MSNKWVISRSSWHYKFSINYFNEPADGCTYFWGFILSLFLASILLLLVSTFTYIMATDLLALMILLNVLATFLLPPLTISYLRRKLNRPLQLPLEKMAVEYLKAKKNKLCPIIEYVD